MSAELSLEPSDESNGVVSNVVNVCDVSEEPEGVFVDEMFGVHKIRKIVHENIDPTGLADYIQRQFASAPADTRKPIAAQAVLDVFLTKGHLLNPDVHFSYVLQVTGYQLLDPAVELPTCVKDLSETHLFQTQFVPMSHSGSSVDDCFNGDIAGPCQPSFHSVGGHKGLRPIVADESEVEDKELNESSSRSFVQYLDKKEASIDSGVTIRQDHNVPVCSPPTYSTPLGNGEQFYLHPAKNVSMSSGVKLKRYNSQEAVDQYVTEGDIPDVTSASVLSVSEASSLADVPYMSGASVPTISRNPDTGRTIHRSLQRYNSEQVLNMFLSEQHPDRIHDTI